jgi:hypothetical protein
VPKRFMAYVPGSTPVVVADTTAPTVPTNVTASAITSSGFTVSWTASTDDFGVTGYSVQVDGTTYGTTTGATTLAVSGRAASAGYAVRVQARDAAGNFSGLSTAITVTTVAASNTAPVSLFTAQTPATTDATDGQGITLSTRFTSDLDGNVTGVRFYRAATAPTSVIGLLYSDAGVELARATFGTLTTGWNSVNFATPVAVNAGTYYRAAYFSSGPYVASNGFFASPVVNGHLTGTGGYYGYSATPTSGTQQFNNGSYFADVLFAASATAPATAPATPAAPSVFAGDGSLTVTWVAPANGGAAITGYDLQPFAGATGGTVKSVGAVLSTTITGLTNGTAYTVKLRAKNAVGNSAYSAASAAATPALTTTYPDASNTGVPAGTTLTAYTGSSRITAANTIIEDKLITVGLTIIAGATNVIIRRCKIDVGQNYNWGILSDEGESPQILDCELIGGTDSTVAGNYTMRRCNVSGSTDGLKASAADIQDSYLHDFLINSVTDTHNDGIQCLGTNGLTIRHNRIIMGVGATSCILLSTGSASDMRNVLMDNNLVAGGAYAIYGGYQSGVDVQSKVSNIVISNNKFSTVVHANSGLNGPITSRDAPVVVSGNTWWDGPNAGQPVT